MHPSVVRAVPTIKPNVGLNVHWSLGGVGRDELYAQRLDESDTRWVREHFSHDAFASNPENWYVRYDDVLDQYRALGIHVVGMLAYSSSTGDQSPPNHDAWQTWVREIVRHFGDRVDVWEVWNEPDNAKYLQPNTPDAYAPILRTAARVIRRYDPSATILGGVVSWPNAAWIDQLYAIAGSSFDELAFHVYTCSTWAATGSHARLRSDLSALRAVLDRRDPAARTWVTEVGCSTGQRGSTEERQRDYLASVTNELLATGWVQRVFLYAFRDRDDLDVIENNFGILHFWGDGKRAWSWYRNLPAVFRPYGRDRDLVREQRQAVRLRAMLERFFGPDVPYAAADWPGLVNAFVYGGYPRDAIIQAIRFDGVTVHPTIPWSAWRKTSTYRATIRDGIVNGLPVYAYGRARLFDLGEEQRAATELRLRLASTYGLAATGITEENWTRLVRAYVYGAYPVRAIARAVVSGGKTVHPTIAFDAWKLTNEYRSFSAKPIH